MPIRSAFGERAIRRVELSKAKGKAGTRSALRHKQVQAAARAMEPAVRVSLVHGITTFKKRISRDALEAAFLRGDAEGILRHIPWEKMPADLDGIVNPLTKATVKGAGLGIKDLPEAAQRLVISADNRKLKQFIDQSVGNRITEITEEARRAVRAVVRETFRQAQTPREAARTIRESVGLTEKVSVGIQKMRERELVDREKLSTQLQMLKIGGKSQTPTAMNVRAKLLTLSDDQIQARVFARMNAAAENRSVTIARTELTDAVNEGQLIAWDQAIEDGLADREKMSKTWVSVPDEDRSDICEELEGQTVPIDGQFESSVTGESYDRPGAHPNCRSSVVLNYES